MSEETPRQSGPEKKPARSVTTYLIILFLAALLLLLLSFFMQQRQALMDLNDTVAASQNATELQLTNQQLTFQLEELRRQSKEEKAKLESERKEAQALAEQAQKQAEALEWLRQIEGATRNSYSKSKDLVEAFEKTGLKEYLPEESAVEGGTSPAETYQNIYAMLF